MPQIPDDLRNRRGCFVIVLILAIFMALYLFAGFNAEPGNNVTEEIPAAPG